MFVVKKNIVLARTDGGAPGYPYPIPAEHILL